MIDASKKFENRLKKRTDRNKAKEEKKSKDSNKNAIFISVFILVVMVGSTFGFIMYYNDDTKNNVLRYNGYELKNDNNISTIKTNGKNLEFYNHPTQLESIPLNSSVLNELLDGNVVVVTFDPDAFSGYYVQYIDQVRLDLSVAINAVSAVTNKSELYASLPVLTCANRTFSYSNNGSMQTQNLNIIYLKKSNTTAIRMEPNGCVVLESPSGLGFLELKDRLVYGIYGIMK
jgi:hypothetical protein